MKNFHKITFCVVLAIFTGVCGYLFFSPHSGNGTKVHIKQNGKRIITLPLALDTKYELATNAITVEAGKVHMSSANCPDKLCMQTPPTNRQFSAIVCLPNKVVLEIE